MSKYWSPGIKNIKPYVPGEQPKKDTYIKLNTNENPYPPSPKVIEAVKGVTDTLRLYPEPTCEEFKTVIADYYNIEKDQVYAGNGSDELLAFSFMAFFLKKRPVLFTDITYSFYTVYANLFNIKYKFIPLNNDFTVPVEKFNTANDGIIIANPNAPTGIALPAEKIVNILEFNRDNVVLVDEAYIDFGGESMVEYINDHKNLLVIQTLSKSRSLAGLRGGFAMGSKELMEGLDRVKNSFNSYTMDRLALAGAVEAFKDDMYFQKTTRKIIDTRERVKNELNEMGFEQTDSKSNFLFISHPMIRAEVMFNKLREKKILVRYFDQPGVNNYLRVTIGTDEQMDIFVDAVKDIISKS